MQNCLSIYLLVVIIILLQHLIIIDYYCEIDECLK
jgi:hypothetical protein